MYKLLIILIVGLGIYKGWEMLNAPPPPEPLYDTRYVAVYGRDSCGYTRRMLQDLQQAGLEYEYFIVDESPAADLLHSRMNASGISTRRYELPVVDVSGELSTRPDSEDVIETFLRGY